MVYESDFYTTRRPYRSTPAYSTYTTSPALSRQIRVLPGLGKVHIVHSYDRIVPYVGHKRLTVVTLPPKVYSTRNSVLQREYDWIENKVRPWVGYSPTNRYLNSDSTVRIVYYNRPIRYDFDYFPRYYNKDRFLRPISSYIDDWPVYKYNYYRPYLPYIDYLPESKSLKLERMFDDETRLIRAQSASLLKQIHLPLPRIRTWPIAPLNRFGDSKSLSTKYSNDTYIHKLLTVSPSSKIEYATYYTEPVRKYIGDKGYNRRQPMTFFEDAVKNDIKLLSYYINRFREEKAHPKDIEVPLSPSRPSRVFTIQKPIDDPIVQEIKDLRDARAARLAKIYSSDDKPATNVETDLKAKQKKEEARIAEEKKHAVDRALAEEQARKEAQSKKEEAARKAEKEDAARKAELARQEQLAAQAAAERAAELEKQAENARQEELAKQAEIAKQKEQEEERRRQEDEAKAEEERQQLLRLEEIARQAEAEKEADLARQADELAELARQEEKERQEKEREAQEAELAELARQEAELAELERQEQELAELARQEAELAAPAAEEEPIVEEAPEEEEVEETTEEPPAEEEAPAETPESEEVEAEAEPTEEAGEAVDVASIMFH